MQPPFQANCLPLLIGSIPMKDHQAATDLVLTYTPEIPLWVQLPTFREEGMIPQFLPGMPGVVKTADSFFVDEKGSQFEAELLAFYEEYLAVSAQESVSETTRFAMTRETANGFFVFMDQAGDRAAGLTAVKGQITGPITFATGLHDAGGRAVFYNEQLRDVSVKLLAIKARWQAQQLKTWGKPVIVFFDEPALAGYGSSAFISITREEISTCFEEVVAAVHGQGAIAGIHVCANADWSLLLDSSADVVSFDAYTYFDKLALYGAQLRAFLERGGILAWGIVPTLNAEEIDRETAETLTASWWEKAKTIEGLGIERSQLIRQSLITPSCGTGSLDLAHAEKVLTLTRDVSRQIRKEAGISA